MMSDHTYEHFYPPWDDPNASVYSYRLSDDGVFTYARYPPKYRLTESVDDCYEGIRYAAGFDELFKEEGYVTFEGGVIQYYPTQTVSLNDSGRKDLYIEVFEDIKENCGGFKRTHRRDFDTIEELFSYNREHFGMAS